MAAASSGETVAIEVAQKEHEIKNILIVRFFH